MRFSLLLHLLPVAALTFGACANKNKSDRPFGGTTDSDSVSGMALNGSALPERQEGVSFLGNNVDRNRFSPIYFGYDSYTVSPSDSGKIRQIADHLRGGSGTIILAGFTDERGTPEYNRGLGERRALAVRQAVVEAGGNASRIQTVSFGAELPADTGSGESAWAKNRRTEIGVVR
jgi:peptidoglycan-associated lipoprotein